MKKSLFLYLFIIAVLMNVFTYKYFTSKEASEQKPEAKTTKTDSIPKAEEGVLTNEPDVFSLDNNDRAQNYLFESANVKDIAEFKDKVTQALLSFNDAPEGNKYTDQPKMGEQKYIINSVKIINHRWIVANYSNGQLWGEVLLKYFIDEKGAVSFEIMNSYLYPASLN